MLLVLVLLSPPQRSHKSPTCNIESRPVLKCNSPALHQKPNIPIPSVRSVTAAWMATLFTFGMTCINFLNEPAFSSSCCSHSYQFPYSRPPQPTPVHSHTSRVPISGVSSSKGIMKGSSRRYECFSSGDL